MRSVRTWAPIAAALLAGACSDSGSTGPKLVDHIGIALSHPYRSFPVTDTMRATVIAYAIDSTWLPAGAADWQSLTPGVASVDMFGLITAVGPGTATIQATSSGKTAQVQVTVHGTLHTAISIAGRETWALADTPHVVRGYIEIGGLGGRSDTSVLTIEPGVTVRFRPAAGLRIGEYDPAAVRIAPGASVVMEGDLPGRRTWVGLLFLGAGRSELRNLTMRDCGDTVHGGGENSCLAGAEGFHGAPELLLDSVTIRDGHNALDFPFLMSLAPGSRLLSVENSDGYLARISGSLVATFPRGGHFTGNAESDVQILSGSVSDSTTWTNLGGGANWRLAGGVAFTGPNNPVLTLPAGFHLRADQGATITFETGGIIAGDPAGAPVVLESNGEGWGGLAMFHGAGSALKNVILRDCGLGTAACLDFGGISGVDTGLVVQNLRVENSNGVGVSVETGSFFHPSSTNLTITGSADLPLMTRSPAVPSIPDGAYTGNGRDAIYVRDGDVGVDATWRNLGVTYLAPNGVGINTLGYVPPTLTIAPGVTVLFGAGTALNIGSGTLTAVGTLAEHIVFGSMTPGTPGAWTGIGLGGTESHAQLEYVDIVDAGGGPPGYSGAVRLNADPGGVLRNSTILRSADCGVILFNGQPWTDDYTDPAYGNSFIDLGGPARCAINPF